MEERRGRVTGSPLEPLSEAIFGRQEKTEGVVVVVVVSVELGVLEVAMFKRVGEEED